MLIKIRNRILKLEAISSADLHLPSEDSDNDWVELALIIDGLPTSLIGDDALSLWAILTQNSSPLGPTSLKSAHPELLAESARNF
jgi:hypothetical protein